jgi:hypothetical protein
MAIRFVQVFSDAGAGLMGWSDHSRPVDTKDEAEALVAAPMPRGCWKQEAAELVGGKWVKFASRERPRGKKRT